MDLVSSSICEEMLDSGREGGGGGTPSMKLLIKFQRLLVAELYSSGPDSCGEGEQELEGVLALLRKYLHYLSCHVLELLPTATATAQLSSRHFMAVANILDQDLVGVLLPELVVSLILLQVHAFLMYCPLSFLFVFLAICLSCSSVLSLNMSCLSVPPSNIVAV